MERERIEMLIKHHELIRDRYAGSDFACTQQEVIEVLRLALLAIDSERARCVGEAVIEAVNGWHAGHFDDDIKHLSESGFAHSAALLSAIAAALRGEP